jgi:hypothetical protein
VTSRPSTATVSAAASVPGGGITCTSASSPEIRSARFESTRISGRLLPAHAGAALAPMATSDSPTIPKTTLRMTPPGRPGTIQRHAPAGAAASRHAQARRRPQPRAARLHAAGHLGARPRVDAQRPLRQAA